MLGLGLPHSFQQIMFLVIGLLGIGIIITVHELGHFLFCKLFSVRTPTFSIGFGPKIYSRKIGQTEFALSAIPLGGYVEIAGSAEMGQGEQKEAHATDEHSFARKSWLQKTLIMLGGVIFNLLFGYFVMVLLFMTGMPSTPMFPINAKPTIAKVEKGSPAEKAGLLAGDTITAINETVIQETDIAQVTEKLAQNPHGEIVLTVQRGQETLAIPVTLGEQKDPFGKVVGMLGVTFTLVDLPRRSFIQAFKEGMALTNRMLYGTYVLVKRIFTKGDTKNVGGAVMIISQTMKSAELGIKMWLLLLAIISLNLALINLIPLPILDGGQVLFVTIEAIIRRPMPLKVREYIHIFSWILMLVLMGYLIVKDIITLAMPR